MKNTGFWKKDWFLGLLVPVIFFLSAGTETLRGLEWQTYDWGVRLSPERPANQNVVVVALDQVSLNTLGSWPWSRDRLAELNRRLARAGTAVTGYVLPFDTPQNEHALAVLAALGERPNGRTAAGKAVLREARDRLNTDRRFAASLAQPGAILLSADYALLAADAESAALPAGLAQQVLGEVLGSQPPAAAYVPYLLRAPAIPELGHIHSPVPEIARAADAIGYGLPAGASPDAVRASPLVLRAGEQYLPSFPLLMAAHTLGLDRSSIAVKLGQGIELAGAPLVTDPGLRAFPFFYSGKDGEPPFQQFSAAAVLAGEVPKEALREKTVLIGLTGAEAEHFDTPLGEAMPAVMVMAHTVSSLLNGELFRMPDWAWWGQLAVLLGIALYLMFVLPRFRLGTGIAVSALLLVVLINTQIIMMIVQATWVPLAGAALALVLGHGLLSMKWRVGDRVREFQHELSESNRQLGLAFQSQGQLDHAFDKYRRCLLDDSLCAMLYNLGLDYERKRQFSRAAEVFRHIAGYNPKYRDIQERTQRNAEMESSFVLGKSGNASAGGTLIISSNGLQKPMLGRYQVERELGRGAMGMVYLGKDPKINRTVAIKTMALAQEFEGDQLEDVKRRFFREAETAGRLNHPNIVTIYDVGEEQDLAYIAMDYLKGENLLTYGKTEALLPAAQVFEIIAKVAEALDYAHEQRVVHRDVKPANIIYDIDTGTVKVTDFGVAHLTDASKTKTGTILGSPSYMSPEQLAGNRVDGRSDLFSLGITFYQLITGELPFVAESLASLMYKIANEKHPDVRMFRPDLPSCVGKIVNKALHKEAERRFQRGAQFASALRKCKESLKEQG